MGEKRMARDRCIGRRAGAKLSSWPDENSISEYERGTRIAGYMFCAMLAFMTVWTVVFQW